MSGAKGLPELLAESNSSDAKVREDMGLTMAGAAKGALIAGMLFVVVLLAQVGYILYRSWNTMPFVDKHRTLFTAFLGLGVALGATTVALLAEYQKVFLAQVDRAVAKMRADPMECVIDGRTVRNKDECEEVHGGPTERSTEHGVKAATEHGVKAATDTEGAEAVPVARVATKGQQFDQMERDKENLKAALIAVGTVFGVYSVFVGCLLYVLYAPSGPAAPSDPAPDAPAADGGPDGGTDGDAQ